MTPAEKHNLKSPEKAACAAAVATAAGAVICGVCCALPFALPAVALAGGGTLFAWLGGGQAWVTIGAAIVVAGAWGWIGWQSIRSKCKPARATLYVMGIATIILALAFLWPMIEPQLVRAFA